jgi:hypothetical protein
MKKLVMPGVVLAPAIFIRVLTRSVYANAYSGNASPQLRLWPGTLIFGFYFALVLAALRGIGEARADNRFWRYLGLALVAGFSADLVFNNIIEAQQEPFYLWYGFVVLWDFLTLFVFWIAIDLLAKAAWDEASISVLLAMLPALKVGREILVMRVFSTFTPSVVDFVFGDLFSLAWIAILVSTKRPADKLRRVALPVFVFVATVACAYWALSALEHAAAFAFQPLLNAWYPGKFPQLRFNIALSVIALLIGLTTSFILARGRYLNHPNSH